MATFAAIDETISFHLYYDGETKVNEEKISVTTLSGKDTPTHSKVRIKVDVEGPATPKLLAVDSAGEEHDIAQIGYWGPSTGFAISGTFRNETMTRATYPVAGTYTIKLTLLDVTNGPESNEILAQQEFTINVKGEEVQNTNELTNEMTNSTEQLPKTGTSIVEYGIYAILLLVMIYVVYQIRQRRK